MRSIYFYIFAALVAGLLQTSGAEGEALKTFDIRPGQEVSVGGDSCVRVKFVSVDEDSRCPEGVDCIWAGSVRVTLLLSGAKSGERRAELNTGQEPRVVEYGEHTLRILKVRPPKVANKEIKPDEYVVTLEVSTGVRQEAGAGGRRQGK